MLERFTKAAREVVVGATAEAQRLGQDPVGPEHLLLSLATGEGAAATVLADAGLDHARLLGALLRRRPSAAGLSPEDGDALASIGIDLDVIRERLEENFGPGALNAPASRRRPRFSKEAKKALELSLREAIHLKTGALLDAQDGPMDERDVRSAIGWTAGRRFDVRGIGTEHLLLGVIRGGGLACSLMLDLDVQPMDIRGTLLRTIADAA